MGLSRCREWTVTGGCRERPQGDAHGTRMESFNGSRTAVTISALAGATPGTSGGCAGGRSSAQLRQHLAPLTPALIEALRTGASRSPSGRRGAQSGSDDSPNRPSLDVSTRSGAVRRSRRCGCDPRTEASRGRGCSEEQPALPGTPLHGCEDPRDAEGDSTLSRRGEAAFRPLGDGSSWSPRGTSEMDVQPPACPPLAPRVAGGHRRSSSPECV